MRLRDKEGKREEDQEDEEEEKNARNQSEESWQKCGKGVEEKGCAVLEERERMERE